MLWNIRLSRRAEKDLSSLDRTVQKRITAFLYGRLAHANDPRVLGEAMQGNKYAGQFRFRVGDYRLICFIKDAEVVIEIVRAGHRRDIYER